MSNVSSSNSQGVRVPKLRFPGFKGEYSSEKIGEVFSERNERGGSDMELLSVTMNDGVVKRSELEGKDNSSEDKSNYKIVHIGDMVYNSMRMWQGANGISSYDGIVSPAYTVLTPKKEIVQSYFAALFKTNNLINEFRKNSQGLTSDTWNLKYPQISNIRISIPQCDEQTKISDFLQTLDKRIAKQHQLVKALKSYKRGVSTALFTRKLRLSKSYSSHNIEWDKKYLGDIFSERTEKATGNEKLLAVTINNGIQDRTELDLKDNSSDDKRNYRVVHIGDLAYNTMRMWQGACGVSAFEGIVSPAYTVLYVTDSSENFAPFWGYYFKETSMLQTFQRNSQGLTSDTWNLKYEKFAQISVYAPPFQEQIQIADFLDRISDKIAANEDFLNSLVKYKRGLLSLLFI